MKTLRHTQKVTSAVINGQSQDSQQANLPPEAILLKAVKNLYRRKITH